MKSAMVVLHVVSTAKTRIGPKTVFVIFIIVASFIITDVLVGSNVDVYKDFTASRYGMFLFVAGVGVLVLGTYFILRATQNRILKSKIYEDNLTKVTWTILYVMIALMAFVIFHLLLYSEYYTSILAIAPTISYGFAIFVLSFLAYRLLSWFIRNRTMVVLMYGLASISTSLFLGLIAIIFNNQIFVHHPVVTTIESAGIFPPLETEVEEFLVITLSQILTASTFLLFWGGTVSILYANLKRIGKLRFGILVTAPIIFFMGTLIFYFPVFQDYVLPADDESSIIFSFYITTLSQVASIALFAVAFAVIGRAVPNTQVSYYMHITCYGFALFSISILATVSAAGYPPFGLPSVSLVGPFSMLLFIGLNHSAIATAEDSSLRRTILITARQQLRFLDSIGTAEWERDIQKKVLEVTRTNAEKLKQESGIEASISMDEAKLYIFEVLDELKNLRR